MYIQTQLLQKNLDKHTPAGSRQTNYMGTFFSYCSTMAAVLLRSLSSEPGESQGRGDEVMTGPMFRAGKRKGAQQKRFWVLGRLCDSVGWVSGSWFRLRSRSEHCEFEPHTGLHAGLHTGLHTGHGSCRDSLSPSAHPDPSLKKREREREVVGTAVATNTRFIESTLTYLCVLVILVSPLPSTTV